MATITFGKYSGKSTEELKQIDQNYLAWGAQNLKSDYWRKEFAVALRSVTRQDTILEMCHWDNISPEEADAQLRHIEAGEAEDARLEAEQRAKEDAVFAKWAPIIGKSVADTHQLCRYWGQDWKEAPATRFSSPAAFVNFCAMMAEWEQATA